MPEGNEIHRWAERHAEAFAGKTLRVDGPQGRFTDSDVIDGRKLKQVRAVGKHLGYDFGTDRIVHIHMGLRGDFTEGSGALPAVRGALRLRMWNAAAVKAAGGVASEGESRRKVVYSEDDGTSGVETGKLAWVELRGPTDCSIYSEEKWKKLEERLGPDPLNGDGPEKAIERIRKSKKSIAALLMDQSVIAGLGNIYRAELLYRARLNPFVRGMDTPEAVLRGIWKDAGPLMKAGMVDRRIVTTRPEDRPSAQDGSEGKAGASKGKNSNKTGSRKATPGSSDKVLKEEAHYVYRRNGQPCFVCGTKVMRQEMEGRNLFWCPVCQAKDEAKVAG